eukprot:maker-scaffold_16-snap-gene-2.49-mRNA-1 protein AED:0.00 eAED:0.00 QI:331/1/1/1/1/1/2/208/500
MDNDQTQKDVKEEYRVANPIVPELEPHKPPLNLLSPQEHSSQIPIQVSDTPSPSSHTTQDENTIHPPTQATPPNLLEGTIAANETQTEESEPEPTRNKPENSLKRPAENEEEKKANETIAKRLRRFEEMKMVALRNESVGKRPPKDMKRLDPTYWYEVLRVAKWGDTPALLLTRGDQVDKKLLHPVFSTYYTTAGASEQVNVQKTVTESKQGQITETSPQTEHKQRTKDSPEEQSSKKQGEPAFYKPPKDFLLFDFRAGDKVRLTRVGYSRSRNLVAQAVAIEPTAKPAQPTSFSQPSQSNNFAQNILANAFQSSFMQTQSRDGGSAGGQMLQQQILSQITQSPLNSLALIGLNTLLSNQNQQGGQNIANANNLSNLLLAGQLLHQNQQQTQSNAALGLANLANLTNSFGNNTNSNDLQRSLNLLSALGTNNGNSSSSNNIQTNLAALSQLLNNTQNQNLASSLSQGRSSTNTTSSEVQETHSRGNNTQVDPSNDRLKEN